MLPLSWAICGKKRIKSGFYEENRQSWEENKFEITSQGKNNCLERKTREK